MKHWIWNANFFGRWLCFFFWSYLYSPYSSSEFNFWKVFYWLNSCHISRLLCLITEVSFIFISYHSHVNNSPYKNTKNETNYRNNIFRYRKYNFIFLLVYCMFVLFSQFSSASYFFSFYLHVTSTFNFYFC